MSSPADGKAIAYTLNQSPCTWLRVLIFEAGPSSGQLANRLVLRTARGIFSRPGVNQDRAKKDPEASAPGSMIALWGM